jgi:hypothetical protein
VAVSPEERRRGRTPAAVPTPAVVTRSDGSGVFCAPLLGGDPSRPLGPCHGATEEISVDLEGGGHMHVQRRLPLGRRVLLQQTPDGPWVVAHDREVGP